MTPNFTLREFVRSQTATRLGLDNQLPAELMPNARATLQMLERIRAFLSSRAGRDVPLVISSGYRCAAVNAAVGSGAGSDHRQALAADWDAPAFGTPYEICKALAPQVSALGIGQLAHEFGEWVHVSTRVAARPVNRIITISHAGTVPGIFEV
jgi:zinc D-Ala-D-Ala carboxypeptidase